MHITIKSILWLLSAVIFLNMTQADDCDGASGGKKSLTLCQEFQAIRDLAPHANVISIIRSHMQNDIRYRKAVQYMLSPQFVATTRQIDGTAIYQSLLRHFTTAGVNTTDIDSIANIFNCIIIPVIQEATGRQSSVRSVNVPIAESRSLNTVLAEVNQLIPHAALVNTLKTHLANNPQYAAFYDVIRNPSFQTQVMQGFINSQVARPIKTLRKYQIDLCDMVQYAFNLYAQGPAVA